mgnify:CR=1 FL=1
MRHLFWIAGADEKPGIFFFLLSLSVVNALIITCISSLSNKHRRVYWIIYIFVILIFNFSAFSIWISVGFKISGYQLFHTLVKTMAVDSSTCHQSSPSGLITTFRYKFLFCSEFRPQKGQLRESKRFLSHLKLVVLFFFFFFFF